MSYFETYLFVMLDDIRFFWSVMMIVSIIALFLLLLKTAEKIELDGGETRNARKKQLVCIVLLSFLFLFLSIFTPTTKQAAAIYLIPKIYNSDFVQKDLPHDAKEIYGAFKEWVKKEMQEKEKR